MVKVFKLNIDEIKTRNFPLNFYFCPSFLGGMLFFGGWSALESMTINCGLKYLFV